MELRGDKLAAMKALSQAAWLAAMSRVRIAWAGRWLESRQASKPAATLATLLYMIGAWAAYLDSLMAPKQAARPVVRTRKALVRLSGFTKETLEAF